jgi:hypothetical protein
MIEATKSGNFDAYRQFLPCQAATLSPKNVFFLILLRINPTTWQLVLNLH